MPVGRNGGVEIGQRAGVIEPTAFGHEAVEQRQHAIGAIDETAQQFPWIHNGLLAALIETGFGAGGVLGRWQTEEREERASTALRSGLPETCIALRVHR